MGSFSQIRVVLFWGFACSCERLNRKKGAVVAEVSGFKHISVSADSDDDVVIWAGAGTEGASAEAPDRAQFIKQASAEACDSARVFNAADAGAERTSAEVRDNARNNEAPDSAKPAPAPTPVKRTTQSGVKDQDYRETTLDDLKSEPMSKTQKIIIACAIAAVAAAVVYYFVFMR